jgi:hypothetical protein
MITSISPYQKRQQQRHLPPLPSTLSFSLHDEAPHPIPQSQHQSHFVAQQRAASSSSIIYFFGALGIAISLPLPLRSSNTGTSTNNKSGSARFSPSTGLVWFTSSRSRSRVGSGRDSDLPHYAHYSSQSYSLTL